MKLKQLLPIVAVALFVSTCRADTLTYSAYLLGSTVVPPTLAPATANELVTVSGDQLSVHVDFTGLLSSALGVRIHCCADTYTNAPVVLDFPNFPGGTSGVYDHTFSLATDLTGISEADFLTGLSSELAYTDLTSRNFPTGSIRGQLAAITPAPVPEPIPLVLISSGMALCAGLRSRLGQRRPR